MKKHRFERNFRADLRKLRAEILEAGGIEKARIKWAENWNNRKLSKKLDGD